MSRAVISILAVVFSSAVLLLAAVAPASAQGRTLNGLLTRAQGDLDRFWSQHAAQRGFSYSPPSLYLIGPGQSVVSACSGAPIQWHTYCAREQRIYLDVGSSRPASVGSLWASNRDFSIVQILAHE